MLACLLHVSCMCSACGLHVECTCRSLASTLRLASYSGLFSPLNWPVTLDLNMCLCCSGMRVTCNLQVACASIACVHASCMHPACARHALFKHAFHRHACVTHGQLRHVRMRLACSLHAPGTHPSNLCFMRFMHSSSMRFACAVLCMRLAVNLHVACDPLPCMRPSTM
jgi:hypothetical protein